VISIKMAQPKEEWLQAIAKRAAVETSEVERVLSSHRIQPSPVLAQPRRLFLREIWFSGEKDSVESPGPFEFSWTDLEHGLWAMLSEKNLRGKTTIIEIVRWMLRGRPSNKLQDDVRRWIYKVRIVFSLDSGVYEINVETKGEAKGRLSRIRKCRSTEKEPESTTLASFASDGEFEAVMADFFMRAFAMEPISNLRQEGEVRGQALTHGWLAFSGVLFISTNYDVLLGDLPVKTGLTARLMQMFLGIPWVSTLAAAKTAKTIVDHAVEAYGRSRKQLNEAAESRIESIRTELAEKLAQLAEIPSDESVRSIINDCTVELVEVRRQERTLVERTDRVETAHRELNLALQEDQRDLQTHIDAMSAAAVFRRLEPQCCPRCDKTISKARKELEASSHSCSVCGEPIEGTEDGEILKAELQERVNSLKTAVVLTTANKAKLENELASLREKVNVLQNRIESASKELVSAVRRQEAAIAIAALEARLEEASRLPISQTDDRSIEQKILDAVVKETEGRVKIVQDSLLRDVSARLIKFAKAFGIDNLTEADLKGNANLFLVKGGASTSYSKVTPGEKLRLKVATILAIIEVAEEKGVGRHPGLLMIDSPAAQEVSPIDVDNLIFGLEKVARTHPHIQVFVASISSEALTGRIKAENRREVSGGGYLW
jgi:hypothetical protein